MGGQEGVELREVNELSVAISGGIKFLCQPRAH